MNSFIDKHTYSLSIWHLQMSQTDWPPTFTFRLLTQIIVGHFEGDRISVSNSNCTSSLNRYFSLKPLCYSFHQQFEIWEVLANIRQFLWEMEWQIPFCFNQFMGIIWTWCLMNKMLLNPMADRRALGDLRSGLQSWIGLYWTIDGASLYHELAYNLMYGDPNTNNIDQVLSAFCLRVFVIHWNLPLWRWTRDRSRQAWFPRPYLRETLSSSQGD